MHKLEIRGLTKLYDVERERRQVTALSDVSLSVADGEFMAIVGPSGCGKTSLLNIVAGLLRYDSGDVIIDGKKVSLRSRRGLDLTASFPKLVAELVRDAVDVRALGGIHVKGKDGEIEAYELVGLRAGGGKA